MLIDIGIAMEGPYGTYTRIAPRRGNIVNKYLDIMAGVIDNNYRGNIRVAVYDFGYTDQIVNTANKIAQIILQKIHYLVFIHTKNLSKTRQDQKRFRSTDDEIILQKF